MAGYSSQFKVKHACDHYQYHQHLLPPEEEARCLDQAALLQAREHARNQLEKQVCLNCYSRGIAESQLAHLRWLGIHLGDLPLMLGGTDKQTHWARKIRSEKLDDIIAEYHRFSQHLEARQRTGLINTQEAARRRQWCNRSVAWVVDQHDPEWRLEQRNYSGWELVRLAAQSVR